MDPDRLLAGLRELAKKITSDYADPEGNGVDQDDANALADGFEELDKWLAGGGFLPKAWTPKEKS